MLKLGKVQLQIMCVLWEEEKATARGITDRLSEQAPIARSTVQTLLRQLEAKKAVTHEKAERTFFYRPLVKEEAVSHSIAQDLLARVFKGSISGLVAHLLEDENISPEEMQRLRDLVEAKSKGEDR